MTPRSLGLAILALVAAWSAYWFVGAAAKERAVTAWLDAQAEAGLVAEGEVATRGYPMRFDTTIADLRLGAPGTLVWEAEAFELLMLSYVPNRAVAAFPGSHRLRTPLGEVAFRAARATASARVGVDAALPLTEATGVATDLVIAGTGWEARMPAARAALKAATGADGADAPPEAHRIGLAFSDLALPPGLLAPLPDRVAAARLDAVAILDGPLALAGEAARLRALEVAEVVLDWGPLRVRGGPGRIEVGPDGRLSGRVEMRAEGLRALAAALPEGFLRAVFSASDAAEWIFVIERGVMRIGPAMLGPAPVLPPPR